MGQFEAFLGVNFWTALFTLGNTIVLFLVLKHFLFKPVMKMIQDRQQEIDDTYAQADQAKLEAEQLQKTYAQKLSAAEQTGERIVKDCVERGRIQEEQIITQANAQAAAIMDKAAASIALEKKKALNDAKDEISGMAVAIAEKVVGKQLQVADQDELFEQFIDELGDNV